MTAHGMVKVDGRYTPIHGCLTYISDLETRTDLPGICLAELARSIRYRRYVSTTIEITLVCRVEQAYSGGQYHGQGLAVYEVQCETECGDTFYHSLRASSRAQLRADLKQLYPITTIGS